MKNMWLIFPHYPLTGDAFAPDKIMWSCVKKSRVRFF